MKKALVITLCIALCSLMISSVGTASAYQAGFEHTSYSAVNTTTIDGKWTTATEWSDCQQTLFGTYGLFRDKWTMEIAGESFLIYTSMLVEVLDDVTTDTNDYVEICIDSLMDGGTTPKADDYKIVLTPTGATWYKGTGTAWASMVTPASFKFATSVDTSFSSGPAHRIYEIQYEKVALNIGGSVGQIWLRVAAYDASRISLGVLSWPTVSSADAPDTWGYIPWSQDPIPEGFTFSIIMILSTVAVVAGSISFRKLAVKKTPLL